MGKIFYQETGRVSASFVNILIIRRIKAILDGRWRLFFLSRGAISPHAEGVLYGLKSGLYG